MGYYSFYKIIKDILHTILGKKVYRGFLIIFISLIVIFVLGLNNYSKATDSIVLPLSLQNGNTIDVTLPDFIQENNMNFYFDGFVNSTGLTKYTLYATTGKIYYNSSTKYLSTDVGVQCFRLGGFSGGNPNGSYIQQNINFNTSNPTIFTTTTSNKGLQESSYVGNYAQYQFDHWCSADIYDVNNPVTVIYEKNYSSVLDPQILTSQNDFETLLFDVVSINAGDYSTQDLYFLCYDKNYDGTDNLNNIYPIKTFLLNQNSKYFIPERTENSTNGAIYWINRDEIGFNWAIGNTYSFRFAIRTPIESDFSDWQYEYIGDEFSFTISSNVLQSQIDDLNQQTKEKEEQLRHEETINAIDRQTEQDNNFYNDILSNDYDEDQAGDTLDVVSDSTSSIDNSQYIGLFSTVFGKFSNIINGNYDTIETISYPIMNTNQSINVSSDLLSSKIQGSFIYTFLHLFWYFLFGMYIFKFSNNLIRSIKSGSILNGYENNNEVITSTML